MREELVENRKALQGLQEEIPERIVSSQRLSQMRLVMKHQQAATDALRFKQQARHKVSLMQDLLAAWHHVIPAPVSHRQPNSADRHRPPTLLGPFGG